MLGDKVREMWEVVPLMWPLDYKGSAGNQKNVEAQ